MLYRLELSIIYMWATQTLQFLYLKEYSKMRRHFKLVTYFRLYFCSVNLIIFYQIK
jgi:hypothetical protein